MVRLRKSGVPASITAVMTSKPSSSSKTTGTPSTTGTSSSRDNNDNRLSSSSSRRLQSALKRPPILLICLAIPIVALWVSLNVHSMTAFHSNQQLNGGILARHRKFPHFKQRKEAQQRLRMDSSPDGNHELSSRKKTRDQVMLDILQARVTLIELSVPMGALSSPSDSYHGVTARFCKVRWDLYKQDPAKTPMFKDLLKASEDCKSTKDLISVNFQDVVQQVRKYDDEYHPLEDENPVHSLELGGVVAHESRCGSTLTANLITAANPAEHRMYSEAAPPSTVFKRCEADSECDWDKTTKLLQDVLYVMARSNSKKERRVFYKLQMSGSRSLWLWRKAMQEEQQNAVSSESSDESSSDDSSESSSPSPLKWVYIFRDSVEALMSHYNGADDFDRSKKAKAACLRIMMRPPPLLKETASHFFGGRKTLKEMTNTEACAVHLTALNEAAVTEHEEHGEGHFVEYSSLPDAVWEYILPDVFDVPLEQAGLAHMKEVSGVYSKIHGGKMVGKEWTEDSANKTKSAPRSVQKVATTIMGDSYVKLHELAWQSS